MPGEAGHRSDRPLAPQAVVDGVRERDRRLLREGVGRDAHAGGGERIGQAVGGHEAGQRRDPSLDRPDRVDHLARDRGRVVLERRDVDHDQRVDAGIGGDHPDRPSVVLGGRRGDHVHGIADARRGRQERAQLGDRLRRELGHVQPTCLARIGALDPETAGVGHDRDVAPARHRLVREHRRDVEHLLERVGARHADLAQQRVDGRVRRRQQGTGVRRRGAAPGRAAPALHDDHRLLPTDVPHELGEPARVPERLDVEQDDLGSLVLRPVAEQVVRRDVGLVADRDERRHAEPELVRHVDHRDPERARLGHERDPPLGRVRLRERAVQPHVGVGVDHAHAVRADHPHPRRAADVDELLLEAAAILPGLAEPGGDHDDRLHALLAALPRDVEDVRRRHDDEGELHLAGDVAARSGTRTTPCTAGLVGLTG